MAIYQALLQLVGDPLTFAFVDPLRAPGFTSSSSGQVVFTWSGGVQDGWKVIFNGTGLSGNGISITYSSISSIVLVNPSGFTVESITSITLAAGALSPRDIISASLAGNDTIFGSATSGDNLLGLEGDDTLHLSPGTDAMRGGAGDDAYLIDSFGWEAGDVIEDTGGVNDRIELHDAGMVNFSAGQVGGIEVVQFMPGESVAYGLAVNQSQTYIGNEGFDTIHFSSANGADFSTITISNWNTNAIEDRIEIDAVQGGPTIGTGLDDHIFIGNLANANIDGGDGDDVVIFDATTQPFFTFSLDPTGALQEIAPDIFIQNIEAVQITLGANGGNVTGGANRDTLTGGTGNDVFNGAGGNDSISGNDGNDTLSGAGGNDTTHGGDGNDILHGGFGHDNLAGGNGLDRLYGDNGNDRLFGGAGGDRLVGGQGNDTLTGNGGNDKFYFAAELNETSNVDVITDFSNINGNNDSFRLNHSFFSAFTAGHTLTDAEFVSGDGVTAATTADQHIIYDTSTGWLYYDQDGSGGTYTATHFATVNQSGGGQPVLTASDFVVY